MKYLGSYIIRALCAIIIGFLLVKSPGSIPSGITIIAGFFFLISGIISCASYVGIVKQGGIDSVTGTKRKPVFPIAGLGCMLLGAVMVFDPEFFVRFLMYIFGGVLVLGAINQFVVLSRLFRAVKMSFFFWIMPSLILICGLVILFKPMGSAELPFVISGWCLLVYGVAEIINAIKVYTVNKNIKELNKNGFYNQEFSDVEDFDINDNNNLNNEK